MERNYWVSAELPARTTVQFTTVFTTSRIILIEIKPCFHWITLLTLCTKANVQHVETSGSNLD